MTGPGKEQPDRPDQPDESDQPAPSDRPASSDRPAPLDRPAPSAKEHTFGRWMGSMWLYTVLRFGLFFALWGILLLIGLGGYFAALIALVLSVPLSLVLLARPRAAFTAQLQARVDNRQVHRQNLDERLQKDD